MTDFSIRHHDDVSSTEGTDSTWLHSVEPDEMWAPSLDQISERYATTHYGVSTFKARACMWSLYEWCLHNPYVLLVETRMGSIWTSPSTIVNNDWFCARWFHVGKDKYKFDILVKATDAHDLDVEPFGSRGLFIRMGHHVEGTVWYRQHGEEGQFRMGSHTFPIANQMAKVDSLSGKGPVKCWIAGDRNCLMFMVDPMDSGQRLTFWLGNYQGIITNINLAMVVGIKSDTPLPKELGGVLWQRNDVVEQVELPFVWGTTLAHQPVDRSPSAGGPLYSNVPIPISAVRVGPLRANTALLGCLVGIGWCSRNGNVMVSF